MTHKNIFMTETKFHVRHEIAICVMKFMTAGMNFFFPKNVKNIYIYIYIFYFVQNRIICP